MQSEKETESTKLGTRKEAATNVVPCISFYQLDINDTTVKGFRDEDLTHEIFEKIWKCMQQGWKDDPESLEKGRLELEKHKSELKKKGLLK